MVICQLHQQYAAGPESSSSWDLLPGRYNAPKSAPSLCREHGAL